MERGEVVVRARGLVKRYGELEAVAGLDLEARRGSCLGVLGPNGAGKTTTIEILEGLKRPDAGEVEVLGMRWEDEPSAIRSAIGVQLQETTFQDKLSVFETARLFASFYDDARDVGEVLALVGLQEKRDARVVDLSGGQKQRLSIGCALLNRPSVLFLDEPTTGLDPQARRRLWEVVEDFRSEGGTILLTTHYMDEAERLADELIIVDRGKIIAQGSPAEIIDSLGAESVVELTPREDGPSLDSAALEALDAVREVRLDAATFVLTVTYTAAALSAVLELAESTGVVLEDLRTHRPTLEDVFVAMTGKHLRDE